MPNKPAQARKPKKNQILALNFSVFNIMNVSCKTLKPNRKTVTKQDKEVLKGWTKAFNQHPLGTL